MIASATTHHNIVSPKTTDHIITALTIEIVCVPPASLELVVIQDSRNAMRPG